MSALLDQVRAFSDRWLGGLGHGDQACAEEELEKLLADHAATVARLEAKLKQAIDWEDVDDEWSSDIKAAHPVRSGSHEQYGTAMKMVGHRHSKGELVSLVNWLLQRASLSERELDDVRHAREVADAELDAMIHERDKAQRSLTDCEAECARLRARLGNHTSWCRVLCGSYREGIRCGLHEHHDCTCHRTLSPPASPPQPLDDRCLGNGPHDFEFRGDGTCRWCGAVDPPASPPQAELPNCVRCGLPMTGAPCCDYGACVAAPETKPQRAEAPEDIAGSKT